MWICVYAFMHKKAHHKHEAMLHTHCNQSPYCGTSLSKPILHNHMVWNGKLWLVMSVISWVAIYFMLRYDLGSWQYLHYHKPIHFLAEPELEKNGWYSILKHMSKKWLDGGVKELTFASKLELEDALTMVTEKLRGKLEKNYLHSISVATFEQSVH